MYHQIAHNKRASLLVIVLFMLFWLAAGALIGLVFGGAAGVVGGAILFGVLALLGVLYSYFLGGWTVLSVSGAQPADPAQYAQLHNIVEALAVGEGLPKPAVYVIDDPSPNAFATGRSPQHAAVIVTTGLLQTMNREELEGVLAHEMSHIKNLDVRLILIVSTLVAMAGLIGSFAFRSTYFMRGGRNSGQLVLVLLAVGAVFTVVGFVVGPLMQFALSRQRESLADASGVELTRNPAGLLSALKKIAQNDQPLKTYNHATAAMFIDDPLEHHEHWYNQLWSTHPPIQERIAALEAILEAKST